MGVGLDWIGWTGWIRVSILFFCFFFLAFWRVFFSFYLVLLFILLLVLLFSESETRLCIYYQFTFDACRHSGYFQLLNSLIIVCNSASVRLS